MSLHSATITEHVLEHGEAVVIDGNSYTAQLRRMSYKEVAELGVVGEVVISLTLPRAQCDGAEIPFVPFVGMSLTMDEKRYDLLDMPIENSDYYRLTLRRYGR